MIEVDLSPLISAAVEVVTLVLLAVGAIAIRRLAAWLRLREDDEVRAYLETALRNGIDFAMRRLEERSSDLKLETKSETIAEATRYVVEQVPEAVKRLKLDQAAIERAIEARLPPVIRPIGGQ